MTKTKRQLRAEAVERLRECRYHTLSDYVRAMLGWGHEPHFEDSRDALIDLLTDDDASAESAAQDMDNGICVHMCPNDSREKLEADVYRAADEMDRFYCGEKFLDTRKIIGWLDRQAAITERECLVKSVDGADAILIAECAELQAQVDELQEKLRIGWEFECKLQAERDHYRSKFGKCLDYADAIHALMDDEGLA